MFRFRVQAMDETFFLSPQWYNAATLAERIESLRPGDLDSLVIEEDTLQTVSLWRQQSPFDADSWFRKRLQLDGLDEDLFIRVVGQPAADIKVRNPVSPPWLATLAEAFSRPCDISAVPLFAPDRVRGAQTIGFLNLVAPLIRLGLERVRRGAERIKDEYKTAPFSPEAIAQILASGLPWQIHSMLSRTLVLELNIARIEGSLNGRTPEERFDSFLARLKQADSAAELLREYPVLARRIENAIRKWISFSLEFLDHLARDWEAMCAAFLPGEDPGILSDAEVGAGDTHRDGRSVILARFSSGVRIVYKPRSLAVDRHFQELLTWLNDRLTGPGFRTLNVLECGDHGWVEFIEPAPCTSTDQVQKFYERQGGYLALLYALEAVDFHFENLIAAGEHPVLIDLESLFHPHVRPVGIDQPDLKLVSNEISKSVLRIGLLPRRSWSDLNYEGIDLSGLGGAPGQLTPDRMLQWEQIGTDEMRARRERMPMPGAQNRPALSETEIDPLDFADAIVDGFSTVWGFLVSHRDDLMADNGPLVRFCNDQVRAIVRPTRVYALLLHESYHPDMMHDGLELERFLDRLWVGADDATFLTDIIPSERRDLMNDDIPVFTTQPTSCDVWDSTGRRIPDFLAQSGLDAVKERLGRMDKEDLMRQTWFVKASMATLILESEKLRWPRYETKRAPDAHIDGLSNRLLEEAQAVGGRLERLALRDNDDLTWIGLSYANRRWSLAPLQEDLYAGSSGVILALAYLGVVTFDSSYTRIAQTALSTLQKRLEKSGQYIRGIGAFNGLGSLIYLFTHLGVLWADKSLLSNAHEIVKRIPSLIESDEDLDIVGGAAGCIGALACLHKCNPRGIALEVAVQCGERLLGRAKQIEEGIGWYSRIETTMPIAGFSHGSSGIAWALSLLWELTRQERFRRAATDALVYEHTQLIPSEGNWRNPEANQAGKEDKVALSVAWCYGAPGIGLARLHMLNCVDYPLVEEELAIAVETTLKKGFGTNHSLCHGALGNLDFLLQAAELLDDPLLRTQVYRVAADTVESMSEHGWLCGVPLGVESPSLMNGLAGICYGLLRLAVPDRVPSVLSLAPPPGDRPST